MKIQHNSVPGSRFSLINFLQLKNSNVTRGLHLVLRNKEKTHLQEACSVRKCKVCLVSSQGISPARLSCRVDDVWHCRSSAWGGADFGLFQSLEAKDNLEMLTGVLVNICLGCLSWRAGWPWHLYTMFIINHKFKIHPSGFNRIKALFSSIISQLPTTEIIYQFKE